jgi:hypothetical protein
VSLSDAVARCSDAHLDDWGERRRPVFPDEDGATWVVDGRGSRTLFFPESTRGLWRLEGRTKLDKDGERTVRTMEALMQSVMNPQPARKWR